MKIRRHQLLQEQEAIILWKLTHRLYYPIKIQWRNGNLEVESLKTIIYFLPELCDKVNTELVIMSSQPFSPWAMVLGKENVENTDRHTSLNPAAVEKFFCASPTYYKCCN